MGGQKRDTTEREPEPDIVVARQKMHINFGAIIRSFNFGPERNRAQAHRTELDRLGCKNETI